MALYHNPNDIVACDANPAVIEKFRVIGRGNVKFIVVPEAAESSYLGKIREIVKDEGIGLVIPTVDEELSALSGNEDSVGAKVLISPKKTISTCLDKAMLYKSMKGEGFCPVFVVASERRDLEIFGNGKVFMKPRAGRGSRGTMLYDNVSDIPDDVINSQNVFCENLPGREYTVDSLFDFKGNLLVAIPRVRLETLRGISIRGKTEKNLKIIKNVERISKMLRFFGPVNIQFKMNENCVFKLVEINPRLSGGLPLSVASGVDIPSLLPDIAEGKHIRKERLEWKETEAFNEIVYRTRK